MYEALTVISTLLVLAVFIPANGFPILLATTGWKDNSIGKSLMSLAISLALLVDFALIFKIWEDTNDLPHAIIRVVVYSIINLGMWWTVLVIWDTKMKAKGKKASKK